MIGVPLVPFVSRRLRVRVMGVSPPPPPPPPPPPVALVLVAAEIVGEAEAIRLSFDRAINADGLDASAIYVQRDADPGFVEMYLGTGAATVVDAQTIDVALADQGANEGSGALMNVTAPTGIVAVDDGGTWPGVTLLPLPFP